MYLKAAGCVPERFRQKGGLILLPAGFGDLLD
jgi:hypothetical protein